MPRMKFVTSGPEQSSPTRIPLETHLLNNAQRLNKERKLKTT